MQILYKRPLDKSGENPIIMVDNSKGRWRKPAEIEAYCRLSPSNLIRIMPA